MLGFFFKKNFCDIWDNMFFLILSNIIPVTVIAASYYGIMFASKVNPYLPNLVFILCSGFLMTVLFAWGANARKLADFNTAGWGLFLRSLKSTFFTGFFFGALIAALLLVARNAFSFYFIGMYGHNGNMMGMLFAALIGWFLLVVIMSFQWFVPLYFLQEQNGFMKCLKKSFIIFFDNASFSFVMLLNNCLLLALSIFTFGFIPGLNGITLSNTNALRLRLYKYDWLEEHEEYLNDRDKRNEVPWGELIARDKESLGSRNLGSFLFPWK